MLADLARLKGIAAHSPYHYNIVQTMEIVVGLLDPDQPPDSISNTNTMTLVETLHMAAGAIELPAPPDAADPSTLN